MPQPKGRAKRIDAGRNNDPPPSADTQAGITWNDIRHFVPKDFTCACEGLCDHPAVISLEVVAKLDRLADLMGRPITILSGTRCERYNARLRGTRLSSHTAIGGISYAADVYCPDSGFRFEFLSAALPVFNRIGVGKDHIHVDDHPTLPGRVVWLSASYTGNSKAGG